MRKRRLYMVHGPLEKRYLRLIFLAAAIPTLLFGSCLYYLIFTTMAEQIGIPEYIAESLLPVINKVNIILLVFIPVVFAVILIEGLIVTHSLTGPIERIKRELDHIVSGNLSHRIIVRRSDRLKPLVDDINALLEKIEKKS